MEESQEDNEVEEIVQRLAFDAEAATRGIASSPQLEERPSSEEGSAPTQKDVKKLESENEDLREEIEELDGGSRPSRRSVREDAVEGVIEAMLVGPLEKEAFQEEIHRLQEAAHIAQRQASHLEARTEELSLAAIENAADVADSTLDCLLKDLEAPKHVDDEPSRRGTPETRGIAVQVGSAGGGDQEAAPTTPDGKVNACISTAEEAVDVAIQTPCTAQVQTEPQEDVAEEVKAEPTRNRNLPEEKHQQHQPGEAMGAGAPSVSSRERESQTQAPTHHHYHPPPAPPPPAPQQHRSDEYRSPWQARRRSEEWQLAREGERTRAHLEGQLEAERAKRERAEAAFDHVQGKTRRDTGSGMAMGGDDGMWARLRRLEEAQARQWSMMHEAQDSVNRNQEKALQQLNELSEELASLKGALRQRDHDETLRSSVRPARPKQEHVPLRWDAQDHPQPHEERPFSAAPDKDAAPAPENDVAPPAKAWFYPWKSSGNSWERPGEPGNPSKEWRPVSPSLSRAHEHIAKGRESESLRDREQQRSILNPNCVSEEALRRARIDYFNTRTRAQDAYKQRVQEGSAS